MTAGTDGNIATAQTEQLLSGLIEVDLSAYAGQRLTAITIRDDGVLSGGSEMFSGFDLDFVWLTRERITSLETAATAAFLDELVFDDAHVTFERGLLADYRDDFPEQIRMDRLLGTTEDGSIDFANVALGEADAFDGSLNGSLSLGEGGAIRFDLAAPVSTEGLYLYIGERLANDWPELNFTFIADSEETTSEGSGTGDEGGLAGGGVSSGAPGEDAGGAAAPADLDLTGTDGDDVIDLGVGGNADLGRGQDIIAGGGGRDTIGGFQGNDTLIGGPDADILTGGPGWDTFQGNLSDLDGDTIRDFGVFDRLHIPDSAPVSLETQYGDGVVTLILGNGAGESARVTLDGIYPGQYVTRPAADGGTEVVYHDTLSLVYVGYFGRAPDPDGYAFWADEFVKAVTTEGKDFGRAFNDIANSFAIQAETYDLYPGLGELGGDGVGVFLGDVYGNLFNRTIDSGGLAYWQQEALDELTAGRPVGRVIMDIVSGAYNGADNPDADVLGAKSQASMAYRAGKLSDTAAWSPETDLPSARAAVRDVDGAGETLSDAFAAIQSLFAAPDDLLFG